MEHSQAERIATALEGIEAALTLIAAKEAGALGTQAKLGEEMDAMERFISDRR